MALVGAAIGLSAFLLFWIEPLIGQVVLPVFGGTPAVWAAVLVFFQAAVLLGYLYSHVSATRLGPRLGAAVHLGLAAIAVAWLALLPVRQAELRAADLPEALDVLRLLVVAVGPPVAVLTATTPLLSAWLVAARRPRGPAGESDGATGAAAEGEAGDPYHLYALSNAASLAALLAYPFVLGPLIGLSRQLVLWSAGFVVLCGLLAMTGLAAVRRAGRRRAGGEAPVGTAAAAGGPPDGRPGGGPGAVDGPITWRRRATWILLAAVPSGLLAAVTNFIAADLIAAPLLWIGPLALYLGSFVIAFSARGRRLVPPAIGLAPAAITLLWAPIGSAGGWPIVPLIVLEWAGLAVTATALHGRLAGDRPPAHRLTEFYLVQSVGGVLGGAFVAIVAPLAFDGVWEYPILLVGGLVALAVTGRWRADRAAGPQPTGAATERAAVAPERRARLRLDLRPFVAGVPARLVPYLVVAAALLAAFSLEGSIATVVAARWFLVGALILLVGGPPRFLALSTAMVLAIATFVIPSPALLRDRSFFGVTEVVVSPDGRWVQLMNGTTVHGSQSTDASLRARPTFYYAASGPLGDVFEAVAAGTTDAPPAVAAVGLGAGIVAAYAEPGMALTFFEIDPVVIRVATDPRYFSYIADAPAAPRIVPGDARSSLRAEPAGAFDLVILDAFSSDAIPAHLLTVEALRDDLRVLRPGGLLAIHISNRYYDLGPAIGAAGEALAAVVLERAYSPTPAEAAAGASPSIWVVMTADPATAGRFSATAWTAPAHAGIEPLTDDHPDVLRFLDLGR